MKRIFSALVILLLALPAIGGELTLLAGYFQVKAPSDGVYWNKNQAHNMDLTPPAFGVRYDTEKSRGGYSFGVQYTAFGTVKIDADAVTVDAPLPGGYDPATGGCTGPCAPLATWHMRSETDSIAFIGTKYWDNWFLEGGLNLYQIKTQGYVISQNGDRFNYKSTNYLDAGPMLGGGFRDGRFSVRLQFWRMEGKGKSGDNYVPPAAFNESHQITLLVGSTF